jgi:hypothetical protein
VLISRAARAGIAAVTAVVGLSSFLPIGSLVQPAAAAPLVADPNYPHTQNASTDSPSDLAADRRALLGKQSSAIAIRNATIKAIHARRVQELGYEPSVTDPREMARQIMANKYQWGEDQFSCYDNIIMRESRWIVNADNPTSSAYGIPQALPGSRMAAFGADWRTNPATQIRWGLDYVDDRYGTPCQAWSFKSSHGWY